MPSERMPLYAARGEEEQNLCRRFQDFIQNFRHTKKCSERVGGVDGDTEAGSLRVDGGGKEGRKAGRKAHDDSQPAAW